MSHPIHPLDALEGARRALGKSVTLERHLIRSLIDTYGDPETLSRQYLEALQAITEERLWPKQPVIDGPAVVCSTNKKNMTMKFLWDPSRFEFHHYSLNPWDHKVIGLSWLTSCPMYVPPDKPEVLVRSVAVLLAGGFKPDEFAGSVASLGMRSRWILQASVEAVERGRTIQALGLSPVVPSLENLFLRASQQIGQ